MRLRFSRTIFFIVLFCTSGVFVTFIPYPETEIIYRSEADQREGPYNYISYFTKGFEFPWRSHTQKIYLNITIIQGNISLKVINRHVRFYSSLVEKYVPYWEAVKDSGFTTTINLSPPFQECSVIIYAEENTYFYGEIRVMYLRFASSYGILLLGIAVILISYYGYNIYKMKSK